MAKKSSNNAFITNGFLTFVIVLLTLASVVSIAFWIYIENYNSKSTTVTGYANESGYHTDYDGSGLLFAEFNIYTNENNTVNGEALYEAQFTRYPDKIASTFEKFGIQAVGGFSNNIIKESRTVGWGTFVETYYTDNERSFRRITDKDLHSNSLYYYYNNQTSDGYSYVSSKASQVDSDTEFFWDFGSNKEVYRLKFKGTNETGSEIGVLGWKTTYFEIIGPEFLFADMYETIRSAPEGTSYALLPFGRYFKIYDCETDKEIKADSLNLEIKIKINKSKDGAVRASQSMFNSIAEDPKYNGLGETEENFYDVYTVYNLSEENFEKRTSVQGNGYYLTLKTEDVEDLAQYENLYIQVNINLDDSAFLGFDYYCFDNIKISNIKLTASEEREFVFMNNYFSGTAKVSKITYTSNITLKFNSENTAELVEVAV